MRTLSILLLATLPVIAQTISGDLVVNVTDPSGLVVAGSKLTLIESSTNIKT